LKKNTLKKTVLKKKRPVAVKQVKSLITENLFVAGIGASAGGLEAIEQFFDKTSDKTGIAYVIVQHLDPTYKSLLTELIAKHTKMNVFEITDGLAVKPDCVYVIPPNKDLLIIEGVLWLKKTQESRALRRPIDTFFHSLAVDMKENAIGIVLSGTGTEGTLGLKVIKAEGGLAIVQDPKSAQFKGMPQSAISAKVADFILPAEKIPVQLLKYVKNKAVNIVTDSELNVPQENQLKKILLMIRNQTGYDFSNYKTNTILRRIGKRIAFNQIDSIDDYIALLQHNPSEVEKLYKDFLIGVTSFFRDEEVFDSVEKKAIPHLFKKCSEKQDIRIWVCGCSTGEEAYSLAILFKEALEKNKQFLKVTIFASDIDKDAIEFARNAFYSESTLSNVSKERLSRFFIHKENGYMLKKEIREMVVFALHNVIKDPPFSKMDMISCRNLLIYMNSDLQKRIIPTFHYSLNSDGILLLGTSESIGEYSNSFSVFDPKIKIYKKTKENNNIKPSTEYELLPIQLSQSSPKLVSQFSTKKKLNVSGLTEKILLDNYAPPSVIIDKNNDALYFSGNTGQYLEPSNGEASLNILEMAKRGLKSDLETAIRKSRSTKAEVQTKDVEVKVNEHFQSINLIVKPVLNKETDLGALMIIFETMEKSKKAISDRISKTEGNPKSKVSQLEKELKITRKHLQTAIDELENSNEDLQTTNEEFQSSNEELQSTNEELETSREELQSVNEELITVNTELSTKIEQLSQANDDLTNLLSSIEVATVFLDRDLKIKRFTPAATKIFNLIPSDIDRPVMHLSSNIVYKALADDVRNALRTLAVKSADVKAIDGTWYHMRILPYRTAENIIEGVLVTFVEITEQKNIEEKLKKTNEHLNLIMENLPAIPYTCIADPDVKISFVGKSCEKVTGFMPEQFTNKSSFWVNRIHPADKKIVIAAYASVSKKGSLDIPFRWKCADGKYKIFTNYIRYASAENGRIPYIVGVWQEIIPDVKSLKGKK
jgi:two-component system CheB/CheR fusion protein